MGSLARFGALMTHRTAVLLGTCSDTLPSSVSLGFPERAAETQKADYEGGVWVDGSWGRASVCVVARHRCRSRGEFGSPGAWSHSARSCWRGTGGPIRRSLDAMAQGDELGCGGGD